MYPIRVLHVIGSMNCGGAETLIMNLFRKIDREKVMFDFLVHTSQKGIYDDEIGELGGKIYHIDKFLGKNIFSYYRYVNEFFKTHEEMKIVHGHIGSSASLYLYAAKRNGCVTIAHSHSTGNEKKSLHDMAYSVCSYPTRYIADFFFGCSSEAGRSRFGGRIVCGERYKNFANAIDTERFVFKKEKRAAIRNELGINDKFVIGTVGRISEAKNPLFTVEVFYEYNKINKNSVLLWVGDGELADYVRNKIKELSIDDRVIMLGQKTNVQDYLMGMDIFLFPSKWEGLPTSVIEAQASGINCLLSTAITKEVEITDLITWMALDNSTKEWANKIDKITPKKRDGRKEEIIKSGYDINTQARFAQDLYLTIYKNAKGKQYEY